MNEPDSSKSLNVPFVKVSQYMTAVFDADFNSQLVKVPVMHAMALRMTVPIYALISFMH